MTVAVTSDEASTARVCRGRSRGGRIVRCDAALWDGARGARLAVSGPGTLQNGLAVAGSRVSPSLTDAFQHCQRLSSFNGSRPRVGGRAFV